MTLNDLIGKLADTMDPANARRVVEQITAEVFIAGFEAGIDSVDAFGEQSTTVEEAIAVWRQSQFGEE